MRSLAPLLLSLGCLPAAPSLGEAPPRPDLGSVHDTWSEDDLPDWPPPPADEEGPDGDQAPHGGGDGGDGDGDAGWPDLPALDPGLSSLRLTEVLADPDGKDGVLASPELIELINPGPHSVALAGLVLEARSWPTTSAVDLGIDQLSLMPGQRLAVLRFANDVEPPAQLPSVDPAAITAGLRSSGGLRNADGGVLVRGAMGEIADLLVYGAPQPSPFDAPAAWVGDPVAKPEPGMSLCRSDEGADADVAADWVSCPPSPGRASDEDPTGPQVPQTGTVVITEVLADPVGSGSEEKLLEFVEIQNAGDEPVDLSAFTIADALEANAPGTDPLVYAGGDGGCEPSTCLAPGHRALIVGNAFEGEANAALVLATDDSTIADAGLGLVEPVVLRDGEGTVLSTYRDWLDPQAEPNPSGHEQAMHRVDANAPDEPESWFLAEPSPGQ